MGRDSSIKVLYRMAESQNKQNQPVEKIKPDYVSNESCLKNFWENTTNADVIVFGDRLKESKEVAEQYSHEFHEITQHGNANSFLEIFQYAINNFDSQDIVYFVEDDYIHRAGWESVVREGLERADYVSLYDHPDKYNGQPEQLFYTESTHWKFTGSTTMTFAAKIETIVFDEPIFISMIQGHDLPPDYYLWQELRQQHRRLATPIPAYATHGEIKWLAPCVDWSSRII